jgi:hypothetical protein
VLTRDAPTSLAIFKVDSTLAHPPFRRDTSFPDIIYETFIFVGLSVPVLPGFVRKYNGGRYDILRLDLLSYFVWPRLPYAF